MSMPHDSSSWVSVPELADELQTYRATIFKIIARLGIETARRRDEDRRGQQVSIISSADADEVRRAYLESARKRSPEVEVEEAAYPGYFYVVLLEPELDRNRFKVGFTTDLNGRLSKHKTSAPFAEVLKKWPCRALWERTAIDCVTDGSERLHTEVFRASNGIEEVLERADAFFRVMPQLGPMSADNAESEEAQ